MAQNGVDRLQDEEVSHPDAKLSDYMNLRNENFRIIQLLFILSE